MANFFKKKGSQVATSGIQINDSDAALAQSDFNIEKITEIQNRFTGSMILLYPGRIFIREGLLWKVCRKGPKKRQFFLFNDILVYASVVANRYNNQHILPLSQMSVSAECFYQPRVDADFDEESEQTELDVGNAFQISHADKSFHVFALSSADKANWLVNLHKHINRISQSISSDKQLVTKPVWVPDSMTKECMNCLIKFTAFIRKHHCRRCGRVVCTACSPHRMSANYFAEFNQGLLLDTKKLERMCKDCFKDMSSANVRIGGHPIQQPPPAAVAAQVVSSVLQSASLPQSMESSLLKEDPNNSTDTEDSDDSGNEQIVNPEATHADNSDTVPLPEREYPVPLPEKEYPVPLPEKEYPIPLPEKESQPTPPPRKKKLKKKLEQLVEKKLAEDALERGVQNDNELTSQCQGVSDNDSISDSEDKGVDINESGPMTALDNGKSPKRSRRRKKHMQTSEDKVSSQADESEGGNVAVEVTRLSEMDGTAGSAHDSAIDKAATTSVEVTAGVESETKKTRSRRTKFK